VTSRRTACSNRVIPSRSWRCLDDLADECSLANWRF
jgi:hypothetical protein